MKRKPKVPAEYLSLLKEYEKSNKEVNTPKKKRVDPVSPDSDSDVEFEDVALDGDGNKSPPESAEAQKNSQNDDFELDELQSNEFHNENETNIELQPISVNLEPRKKPALKPRSTKSERLNEHKISLIAWMTHSSIRNQWSNSPEALSAIPQITQELMPKLHPPAHLTQFLKSRRFIDGLREAMETWQHHFRVTGDTEPKNLQQFVSMLRRGAGPRNVLAQGFVSLLRSCKLDSRLVCSLQPPDNLNATLSKPADPNKSPAPIFWAEVWDPYASQWAGADPLTSTLRLPTRGRVKLRIEPALSDHNNVLRYCMAFDGRNNSRDVTRRYSTAYNARTRKRRLDTVSNSEDEWFTRLLSHYTKRHLLTSDKTEIAELARFPRLEGLPQRVQDFVGHPEYALATQLHADEVLKPDAQHVGVLAAPASRKKNTLGKPLLIYRRGDVLTCRSAASWHREGRSIAVGAQPLVHRPHTNRLTGETEETALYAKTQTTLYIPPPIQEGKVPKTQYRTIDIFCESMIPKGGVHIVSKEAAKAAKFLQIDYANAVVGVEFGRRGPTSQTSGVVVPVEHAEAMVSVLRGMRELEREFEEQREYIRIMSLWRKIIIGVQIWERVETMNPDKDKKGSDENESESGSESDGDSEVVIESETIIGNEKEPNDSENKTDSSDVADTSDSEFEALDVEEINESDLE